MSFEDHARMHARAIAEFRTTYGGLMEAWGRLEGALFYWFMWMTGLEERLARAVYFSARNFNGRRDMLRAALPLSTLDPATKRFVRAAIAKASCYSTFRNKAAHGEPNWKDDSSEYVLAEGSWGEGGPGADAITIEQMNTACRNFTELRDLLWDLRRRFSRVGVESPSDAFPEAYLERVLALPSVACSTQSPQTPPKKKRQPRKPRAST